MLFLLNLVHFWCSEETSVNFSSNLTNFKYNFKKKNQKNPEKIQKKKLIHNLRTKQISNNSKAIQKKSKNQKCQKI